MLRYFPGAEYKPHHDYFPPEFSGSGPHIKRGGNRIGTLIIYLNDCKSAGHTIFPDLGLEVMPRRGNGVFFSYDRPHPSTLSLHGGMPVGSGEKWIATRWLKERELGPGTNDDA